MWRNLRAGLAGILILSGSWGAARATLAAPADELAAELAVMHAWLNSSSHKTAWRSLLKSQQLEAELAKGPAADKARVAEILRAYSSSSPGLKHERFATVRRSLEAWLADLSRVKLEELPVLARQEASQFAPPSADRTAHAKAKLAAATATLDRWLEKSGPKVSAGWKKYLAWDDLQKVLDAEAPDAKTIDAVVAKYRSDQGGLELARFIAVRDALREYAQALEFSSADKLKEELPKQLEELAARLEAFAATGSQEDSATAGRLVRWLEQAGQAPTLVAGVRGNFDKPNLYAHVSAALLDTGMTEEVDDAMRVREYILGTDIEGTARTRGRINIRLVPSAKSAAVEILLNGNSFSNTIGYQRSVMIYSQGNTSISASKRLLIDEAGIRGLPAVASCNTSTNITDISASLRLIENIAWRKAGQSKSQAEEIASDKAQRRVAQQMDRRVVELVENANTSFQDKFRSPLVRRGEFPRLLNFSTTKDRLLVKAVQQGAGQLAASTEPPPIDPRADVAVRVHESLASNFAESVIGGETLTDEKLADIMLERTGSVPEELQITPDKDPWSITFHSVQPFTTTFSDETIRFAIRGQRFTKGDAAIRVVMQISATYKIIRTPQGVRLKRDGDVVAEYLKKGPVNVQEVAFRTLMRKKFGAVFKDEIVREEGLLLPGRLSQAGHLQLDTMTADKGWLAMTWKLPAKTRTAQANVK